MVTGLLGCQRSQTKRVLGLRVTPDRLGVRKQLARFSNMDLKLVRLGSVLGMEWGRGLDPIDLN